MDAASRRQPAGAQPGHHAGGPARHPRRPPAAARLAGHPAAPDRHLRLGLQADPARLRRRRQRQRHERLLLLPPGHGPRGGGRRGRAGAGGRPASRWASAWCSTRGCRVGPAGSTRSARRARPATSACAGTSPPRATSPRASTPACPATPPAATPSSCRPTRPCCSRCPTRSATSEAIFADPFSVSLHSITRHPPPPGGKVAGVGRRLAGLVRGGHPAGAVPRRRGRGGGPLRRPGRRWPPGSAPTTWCAWRRPHGAARGPGRLVGRRAAPDHGRPGRPPDVPPGRHRRGLRHHRQARDLRDRGPPAQGAGHAGQERGARAGSLGVEPALLQGDQLGRLQRLRHRGGGGRAQARHRALPGPGVRPVASTSPGCSPTPSA